MYLTFLIPVAALVSQACAAASAHPRLLNRQSDEVSAVNGYPECTSACQALFDQFDRCGAGEADGDVDPETAQCMCADGGFSVMEACVECMIAHVPAGEDQQETIIQLERSTTIYSNTCIDAGVPVASDADVDTTGTDADADPADTPEDTAGAPNTVAVERTTVQTKGAAATGASSGESAANDTAASDEETAKGGAASRPGMLAAAMLAALAGGASLF